jgi:hypothetical protein
MGIAPRGSLVADTAHLGGLLLRRKPPRCAVGSSPVSSWAVRLPVGRCCAQDDTATLRDAHAPPNALWAYACRHQRITRALRRPRGALAGIPGGFFAHVRPSPHFHPWARVLRVLGAFAPRALPPFWLLGSRAARRFCPWVSNGKRYRLGLVAPDHRTTPFPLNPPYGH